MDKLLNINQGYENIRALTNCTMEHPNDLENKLISDNPKFSKRKIYYQEKKQSNCCAYSCGCGCLTLITIPILAYGIYQLFF